MNKFVSILIPFYNAEKHIEETLNSAINQSYENIEIILVDDGSTDSTVSIVEKYLSEKIKLFQQENKGASAARNLAFEKSMGDFIQYLDADDILDKDKIKKQVELFYSISDSKSFVLSGNFKYFKYSISDAFSSSNEDSFRNYNSLDWLIDADYDKTMFPPIVWLSPRNIIEKIGGWNERLTYNDDSEFFARVLLEVEEIVHVDESKSYYRIGNPESYGSQKTEKARISEFESLSLIKNAMLEKENSERVKKSLAYQFSKINYSLYPKYSEIRKKIEQELKNLNVNYPKNFGNGLTFKLGKVLGWKMAKRIKLLFK